MSVKKTLRVLVQKANGERTPSTGSWRSSNANLTITNGLARGIQAGSALIEVSAEGLTTTWPLEIVPDLRGTWTGTLHHPTCNRYVGEGPSICGKSADGMRYQFDAIATQSGANVVLNVTVSRKLFGVMAATIDRAGRMVLEDSSARMDSEHGSDLFVFKTWRGEAASAATGRRLQWAGTLERIFANAWGPQHYWMDATIALTR